MTRKGVNASNFELSTIFELKIITYTKKIYQTHAKVCNQVFTLCV
jgi:hypothetical protein